MRSAVLAVLVVHTMGVSGALWGYYKLETDFTDEKGNNNGAFNAGVQWVAGKAGNGVQMGPGDYEMLQLPSPTGMPTGNSAFSVGVWVMVQNYPGMGKRRALVYYGSASGEDYRGVFVGIDDNTAFTSLLRPDSQLNGPGLSIGVWTHIATTWDQSVQRLYVDGSLSQTKAQPPLNVDGSGALGIGCRYKGGSHDHA
eukprot:Sspe_Gene.98512::Locus_71919_Transcript_1_1_Confidence_1.000_Length_646::g.98512::m.98512